MLEVGFGTRKVDFFGLAILVLEAALFVFPEILAFDFDVVLVVVLLVVVFVAVDLELIVFFKGTEPDFFLGNSGSFILIFQLAGFNL